MWCRFSVPKRLVPAAVAMLLGLAAPVLSPAAECSFVFLPMEEAKYLLKGTGCEEITAVSFTVDYDATDLFLPRVDVMGGKILEEEQGTEPSPGKIDVHIVREDPGAAYFEACIYFEKRESYPTVINFVTAEVVDLSGMAQPVPVERVEPHPLMNEPDSIEAAQDPASPPAETGAPPMEPERIPVFERFRDFAAAKNLASFAALFAGTDPCCRQTPPVVIADGRQTAEVVFSGVEEGRLQQMGRRAPLVTVEGGELVSLQRGKEVEEWIATVRPFEGWWDVWVSLTAADETIDFPLTATPAIDIPHHQLAQIDEKTFMSSLRSFLAPEAGGKPRSAVWFREYLFTANYLAAQEERKRSKAGQ